MANTQGFEIVAELGPPALLSIMQAAWDSDRIPKNLVIPPTAIGSLQVEEGQVQVPRNGLGVQPLAGFGLDLQLELQIQVKVKLPQVVPTVVPPSTAIDIAAKVSNRIPVGSEPGKQNVALLFGSMPPADKNDVTLIGPDPIAAKLPAFATEFVHQMFQVDGPVFPHSATSVGESLLVYTADITVDLYDDPSDPPHQIQVSLPVLSGVQKLEVSIPLHLRVYNIHTTSSFAPTFLDPMGVEARLVLTTDLIIAPGSASASLAAANVVVPLASIVPAGAAFGNEGLNYTANKAAVLPINLDDFIKSNLETRGKAMAAMFPPFTFAIPTSDDIRQFIAEETRKNLAARPTVEVWPNTAAPPIAVTTVAVAVLADALAIAINAGPGANSGLLVSFVPPGKGLAVAISGAKTMQMLDAAQAAQFPSLPTVIETGGDKVRIKSLNHSLTTAIHFSGDITAIDAILDSIDVDASFDVDIGLEWLPPDVNQLQRIKANPGEPDVDLSAATWLLSILTGFLTFGVTGVIVAVIVDAVVESVASSIGGPLVVDSVTGAVEGMGAWPTPLKGIGTVSTAFDKEIAISPDGLLFRG